MTQATCDVSFCDRPVHVQVTWGEDARGHPQHTVMLCEQHLQVFLEDPNGLISTGLTHFALEVPDAPADRS